eukprot:Em0021g503a
MDESRAHIQGIDKESSATIEYLDEIHVLPSERRSSCGHWILQWVKRSGPEYSCRCQRTTSFSEPVWYLLIGTSLPQLFYPIAGWMADACVGRYKVTKISIWLVYIGHCVFFFPFLFLQLIEKLQYVYIIFPVAYLVINVGLAGFRTNIIQFGMDQMVDASASQLSAFIHWYYWSTYVGSATASMILECLLPGYLPFVIGIGISVALSGSALLCWHSLNKWFVKEPKSINPFKIVFKVLKFSSKHKVPIHRSSLTYWDDTKPSRLDLGKTKYGGPFSTEEVEDVKTFFAITLVLLSLGGFLIINDTYLGFVAYEMNNPPVGKLCSIGDILVTQDLLILFGIPVYEFVIYPIFQNYIPTTLKKIGIGIVVNIASVASALALDLYVHEGRYHPPNDQCIFLEQNTTDRNVKISSAYVIIPATLENIAELIVFIAIYEFIFAQSPYSMRSMLVGAFYTIQGLFAMVSLLIGVTVTYGYNSSWKASCGTVYTSITIFFGIIGRGNGNSDTPPVAQKTSCFESRRISSKGAILVLAICVAVDTGYYSVLNQIAEKIIPDSTGRSLKSLLDLGKKKYGGPFSTEEVENVKTFFAISLILVSLGGFLIVNDTDKDDVAYEMNNPNVRYCSVHDILTTHNLVILVAVPLYEFVICPLFRNYIPTSLKKIGIGIVLDIAAVVCVLALDLYVHEGPDHTHKDHCILSEMNTTNPNSTLSSAVIVLPITLDTLSGLIVFVSTFEFIFAQSPYSMRSSLLVIFTYVLFKNLRTVARQLLVNLSVADILANSSHIFGMAANLSRNATSAKKSDVHFDVAAACSSQGGLALFGTVACFLWTIALAFHLFALLVIKRSKVRRGLVAVFYVICWGLPLTLVIAYASGGFLGYEEVAHVGWCYVRSRFSQRWIAVVGYDAWMCLVLLTLFVLFAVIELYLRTKALAILA